MDVRLLIGGNARKYRLAADLSQEAVAERMGVDRAHISALEMGKTNPTVQTLSRLAEALGIKVGLLFYEDDLSLPAKRRASKVPHT
jgi:transcriptional regulator with XRE-family HTH domain